MLETTDPNALVIETARRFAQERLVPTAAAREQAGRIEPEIIREIGEMGFLGATIAADHGGAEIPYETYAKVVEELAAGDGAVSTRKRRERSRSCPAPSMIASSRVSAATAVRPGPRRPSSQDSRRAAGLVPAGCARMGTLPPRCRRATTSASVDASIVPRTVWPAGSMAT